MSENVRTAGAPDTWTLPGHSLYPYRDIDYEQVALYLESRHRRSAADSAKGMGDWDADKVFDAAERLIGSEHFRFNMEGWRKAFLSGIHLPFLLLRCLRDEPNLTVEQAKALITPANRDAVTLAVGECIGYARKAAPKGNAGNGTGNPPDPSLPASSENPSTPSSLPPQPIS